MQGWWVASYVILWFLVVVLCFVVVALARQVGTLHLRLGPRGALEMDDEGPPLGDAPAASEIHTLDGRTMPIGGPGAAHVLMFVSPGCHLCEAVMPSLGVAARSKGMDASILVDADPLEAAHIFAPKRLDANVAPAGPLVETYRIPGTPYVVILDDMGVTRAKGTINNLEQLEGLIDTAVQRQQDQRRHAS